MRSTTQIVATVESVKGQVFARGLDDKLRSLKTGDPLYDGEALLPDDGSAVSIAPEDGSAPFWANEQFAMAPGIDDTEAEMSPDSLVEIMKGLGTIDDLEPPEAGGMPNSMHDFFVVDDVNEGNNGAPPAFAADLPAGAPEGVITPVIPGPPPPTPFGPQAHSTWAQPDHYEVTEGDGGVTLGNFLDNDAHGAGETLTHVRGSDGVWVSVPDNGDYVTIPLEYGSVEVNNTGNFIYHVPDQVDHTNPALAGPDDVMFDYRITDEHGHTANSYVAINIADTAPEAHDDYFGTVASTSTYSGNVIAGQGWPHFDANNVMVDAGPDTPSQDTPVDATEITSLNPVESSVKVVSVVGQDGEVAVSDGARTQFTTEHGATVWITSNGDFRYAPPTGGYSGPDSFQYTIVDADGSSSTATAYFDIPPALQPENYEVVEGSTTDGLGNILANDAPYYTAIAKVYDSATQSYVDVVDGGTTITTELGGTAVVYPDGSFDYTAPVRNHGDNVPDQDSFAYKATHTNPDTGLEYLSPPVTATIDILDTVPEAQDDHFGTVSSTSTFSGNVIDGQGWPHFDADNVMVEGGPDTPSLDTPVSSTEITNLGADESAVKVVSVTVGDTTTAVNDGERTQFTTEQGGTVWITSNGDFRYAPPTGGYSGPDSFQYTIEDGDGSQDTATVTFDVPPAPEGENTRVIEGSTTENLDNVLTNDQPYYTSVVKVFDSATQTYVDVTDSGTTVTTELGGSATIYPDGHYDYTAPVRNHGDNVPDQDSFAYKVANDNGYVSPPVTATIDIDDTVPTAHDDNFGDVAGTSTFSGNVIDGQGWPHFDANNDSVPGGPDEPSLDTPVSSTEITSLGADESVVKVVSVTVGDTTTAVNDGERTQFTTEQGGTVWITSNGDFRYAPPTGGYTGPDSFDYTIEDGDGSQDTATVTFNVPANQVPDHSTWARPDHYEVREGAATTAEFVTLATILANDEQGVGLVVDRLVDYQGNTHNVDEWFPTQYGDVRVHADGTVDYKVPDQVAHTDAMNDNPNDVTFQYYARDTHGHTALTDVSIDLLDTTPTAHDDSFSMDNAGTTNLPGNVITNDEASQDTPVTPPGTPVKVVGVEGGDGYVEVNGDNTHFTTENGGEVTISPDGEFRYDPSDEFVNAGGGQDHFDYTIADADGSTSTATVTIDVPSAPFDNVLHPCQGET
ncbi:MAG: tandem-95 repeat protein, partial [Azoarcus sp.]|nr:tandem-95 repeat protein [Azoarcus sp.]